MNIAANDMSFVTNRRAVRGIRCSFRIQKIEFLHTAFLVFVWTNGEYDVKINKKEA